MTESTSSSSEMAAFLPPLYFAQQQGGSSLRALSSKGDDIELPPEVLSHVFSFCNWGDYAKLACVQSSWRNLLTDLSNSNLPLSKWQLANALFNATDGIRQPHPEWSMQLFMELANVKEDGRNAMTAQQEEELLAGIASDESDEDEESTNDEEESSDEQTNEIASEQSTLHYAPAMKQIAHCYFSGHGRADMDNNTSGLKWLQRAHTLGGDVEAAHEVALLYEYGRLPGYGNDGSEDENESSNATKPIWIEIDVVQAACWFRRAAKAGHIDAMTELALCYELGCGVTQSDEKALDWYMKAAERGHLTAKYSVGEAFEEARGVPQSDAEACLWYYKAALEGDEDSKKALKRLEDIARIVIPGVGAMLDG